MFHLPALVARVCYGDCCVPLLFADPCVSHSTTLSQPPLRSFITGRSPSPPPPHAIVPSLVSTRRTDTRCRGSASLFLRTWYQPPPPLPSTPPPRPHFCPCPCARSIATRWPQRVLGVLGRIPPCLVCARITRGEGRTCPRQCACCSQHLTSFCVPLPIVLRSSKTVCLHTCRPNS